MSTSSKASNETFDCDKLRILWVKLFAKDACLALPVSTAMMATVTTNVIDN
jgi:hypothetical protein